jgi:hypothetical protein
MKPKLTCPECGEVFQEIERLPKMTGVQWDRYSLGDYVLYQCPCGERYWAFWEK